MSRRNKQRGEQLIINRVPKLEYALKNYLHLNDIYKGNNDMQTIIINSFFIQNGGDNETDWLDKLKWVHDRFGKFCQYAQNNWKVKEVTQC